MFLKFASLAFLSLLFFSLNTGADIAFNNSKKSKISQNSIAVDYYIPDENSKPDYFPKPDNGSNSIEEVFMKTEYSQAFSDNQFDVADTVIETQPYLSFSNQPLRVIRNKEVHEMVSGNLLRPGDIIETCARHFAQIAFPPGGTLILFPSSQLIYSEDAESLILKDAEIHFENKGYRSNDKIISTNIPERIYCFEHEITHSGTKRYPVSFAVNCRGDTGMILTSKKASLKWRCASLECDVKENSGIMVQAASVKYTIINLPGRPELKRNDAANSGSNPDEKLQNPGQVLLEWSPVAMADHYVVHLYKTSGDPLMHPHKTAGDSLEYPRKTAGDSLEHLLLKRSHTNRYKIDQLPAGTYAFRVMAIDYYGVSGLWSDVLIFNIKNRKKQ